jgi:signal transduction histidine kinase
MSHAVSLRRLRRLRPRRIRTRLAILYAALFLIAGSALSGLTYGLLASRLPAATKVAPDPHLLAQCKQRAVFGKPQVPSQVTAKPQASSAKPQPKAGMQLGSKPQPKEGSQPASDALLRKCKQAFAAGARAGSQNQRDRTLNTLLVASLIGLGVATLASAALGWFVSGRALRPVRSITDTARRASELQLGERLALTGPDDELKELADTFDLMLERLDAAFASQQRFVANAAHELRTPLTAMRTAIEVTLAKPERTAEQLEAMVARVQRSVDRAERTVEALLTLAISDRGPATPQDEVDLAVAAEDALDAAAPALAERGVTVDAALQPAPVRGDRVLLERMIANLVDNAVRHNQRDGWIHVTTAQRPGGAALFQIANTGPEVPAELIPTLFEPFGRAAQRLNAADGVGLGLSIARAIAVAHGALITARSRDGGGLEVSVELPVPVPVHVHGEFPAAP